MKELDKEVKDSGKTIIMCAHRLSSITNVQQIHVLDNGKVVQQGKHDELQKAKNSVYEKMWKNYNSGGLNENGGSGAILES